MEEKRQGQMEDPQGLFFVVIVFAKAATQHDTWIRVRMKTSY
jgi:hypothetical protein